MRIRRLMTSYRAGDHAGALRSVAGGFVAIALVQTGTVQFPFTTHELRHAPVIVQGEAVLPGAVVIGSRAAAEARNDTSVGPAVAVSLTQYCLRGETRRGRWVRPGIVAADPRIFPLARHVEVFLGTQYLGRYLVDDTGKNIIGNTLDIWTPNCREARRFGRQYGHAALVASVTQP